MSLILKGIDLPEPTKGFRTHIELYVRSDGVVFDDDFEEVGRAIQIPKGHGDILIWLAQMLYIMHQRYWKRKEKSDV